MPFRVPTKQQSLVEEPEVLGLKAKLSAEAEAAMESVAQDFVGGALAFGAALARRRPNKRLSPDDLRLYFQRTWDIELPGAGGGRAVPYRRAAPSEVHRARLAAVRRANAAATQKL